MVKANSIKQKALQFVAKRLRDTAENTASAQCYFLSYEPKIPAALKKASK